MPTNPPTGNVAGPRKPRRKRPTRANTGDVVVTYKGPTDPKDRTTAVTVPHDTPRRDEHFPRDVEVATSSKTADLLAGMAGHKFTTKPATPKGTV